MRAAYLFLLGRPPFVVARALGRGKAGRALADQLIGSPDFWRQWLDEQLFYFLLIDNFRPENERVAALPDDLAAHKLDVREAVHRIALSPSFEQRNPGADTYVTVVLEQLDGVRVQARPRELEIGKRIYDGASGTFLGKPASCQADIVDIAIHDRAFSETFIAREYRRHVHADPDSKALGEWIRRFHRAPREFAALVHEWLLSAAWDRRLVTRTSMSNRMFVRALYVDLLGRVPDGDEARRLRSALDGLSDAAPLRSVFARMLIDSGKVALPERASISVPERWISSLFERLLGRAPSAAELTSFVESFRDPACRPETVLYAIVTHPEYQSY